MLFSTSPEGMASLDMAALAVGAEVDMGKLAFPRGQIENWGDSGVVVSSLRTDTSTDVDADERNRAIGASQQGAIACLDSSAASREKTGDQKVLPF
ncbi:putative transcription factor TGA2.2 [Cocos nucifera]|nr:putative transcription factor TGA2.2 [Cocos nucifera]